MSVKTNDFCSGLMFSRNGDFLIANEKNLVKIYEPFTLSNIGSISPENIRIEVRSFQISENGEFIVYQCYDNQVYRDKLKFGF